MKTLMIAVFSLAMLGTGVANAAISIGIGVHHPRHHRHQVCSFHHHHRVCVWR